MGDSKFIMEFQASDDKEKVRHGKPWTFDRSLIAIQDVDDSLPPKAVNFSYEPFWVQLHNIPLAGMIKEYGELIAFGIGKVLTVEVDHEGKGWGRCLRVRMEVDITKPLARGRWLRVGSRKIQICEVAKLLL